MNLFKQLLQIVDAEETPREIKLFGLKSNLVAADIMRTWSTSRIEGYMFNRISKGLISFPHFFALDVHYMLHQLLHGKRMYTSKRSIEAALVALQAKTWLKDIPGEKPSILDESKLSLFHKTPLPHQSEFFRIYNHRVQAYRLTGYLLSAVAGSGKTLVGLMLSEMLKAALIVVVAPKNAVYNVWLKTVKNEYTQEQSVWVASDGKPYNGERIIIGHYEALESVAAAARQGKRGLSVVILDESHNLNEMESLRTERFVTMCRDLKCQHVLWSSGTPLKALGKEVIPLLRTIDPYFTPAIESRFLMIFGKNSQRGLDILRNRMGIISYKVEKLNVVDNKATSHSVKVKVPNGAAYTLDTIRQEMAKFIEERHAFYAKNMKQYEKIYLNGLELHEKTLRDSEQKEAYKRYKSYIAMIRKGYDPKEMAEQAKYCNSYEAKVIMPGLPNGVRQNFKAAKSVFKYVELKIMGEALGSVLGKKRAQCHVEMVPHMGLEKWIDESEKKTVIFTSFVECANAMEAYLKKKGYNPLVVHGETNKNLTGIISTFEKDPKANPLIATYQSLSTAVPLVMANTAIFTNQPFRAHEKTQAQARVDRLGQDTSVVFVNMLLDTGEQANISTRSNDIMEWSKMQVAAIMGADYSGEIVTADSGYAGLESFAMESYSEEHLQALDDVLKELLR